jgi:hypothetical protein
LRRASTLDKECANSVGSTLSEWGADEDEDAFRDL